MRFFASGLVHRCVVHMEEKSDYAVLSQVDLASWLGNKVADNVELREIFSKIPLISELKNRSSETHQVVQSNLNETVFHTLQKMDRDRVQAVAVVDDSGRLQGNFSVSDLIHLDSAKMADLKLSVEDYLKKNSKWSLTPLAILNDKETMLAETIMLFSGIGVHRIWLVDSPMDSSFTPSGVVSVTDVLQIVKRHIGSLS